MSLEYKIREAQVKTSQQSPAIFMLHGYGSNMDDLFSFQSSLPENYTIFSLQAPISLGYQSYAWFSLTPTSTDFSCDIPQAKDAISQIINFISDAIAKYNLNPQKITLLGFSQGTILSLAIALSHPQLVSRVVGFSGRLEEDMLSDDYQNNDFSNLKIFLSHGTQDQVIPINYARETSQKLQNLGIATHYQEFLSAHNISLPNFNSFLSWLNLNS